jgi:hypothetical protein
MSEMTTYDRYRLGEALGRYRLAAALSSDIGYDAAVRRVEAKAA